MIAALSPYALPLRREGDAAIFDKTGETLLVVDPDRHLENDEDAARLADLVFARLTAAPVREEGGAVSNDDTPTYKRLAQALSRHPEIMVVERSDPTLELTARSLEEVLDEVLPIATREEAPAAHGVEPTAVLQSSNGPVGVDASIASIVQALWNCGLMTVASRSGHTHRPGNIDLADGRELIIARNYDEARKIDALFPTNICGEARE